MSTEALHPPVAFNEPVRRRLANHLTALAGSEGIHPTPRPGVEVLRADRPRPRMPVVYQPCVCVVAQGAKRVYLGGDSFVYDALHYLVLSVPLPLEGEITAAAPGDPFLALRLHIDTSTLAEVMLEAGDDAAAAGGAARRGISASPLDAALLDVVGRLVAAVAEPGDRRVLAPLAERELLYRLLQGEQGALLREFALRDSRSHRIARVLHYMQRHYAEPLDIAAIARVASMSPSTLHHVFKAVTASSPLQYLKKIRLHRARTLMLHDALGAGEAAHRVGYNSEFQFNREYRRMFGAPPVRDVAALRAGIAD